MVAAALIAMTGAAKAETAVIVRGDLNNDGEVTLRDINHAIDYWFNLRTVSVIEALDTNDDGCFDSLDVAVMVDYVFFEGSRAPIQERVAFTRGDVNGDGELGAADLLAIVEYLRGDCSPYEVLDAMDLDADGRITAQDAAELAEQIGISQPVQGVASGGSQGPVSGSPDDGRETARGGASQQTLDEIALKKRQQLADESGSPDSGRAAPSDPRTTVKAPAPRS